MYCLCYFLFPLLWDQVSVAAICIHCCSSRGQNNNIFSIEDVQTKAHLMHSGSTSGGNTEPYLHLSCRVLSVLFWHHLCYVPILETNTQAVAIGADFSDISELSALLIWFSFEIWSQSLLWDLSLFCCKSMIEQEPGKKRSFSSYTTVVRQIVHVNGDRAVRDRRFLLL